MFGSCWQLIVPIRCCGLLMGAQGCPALFWTRYWKFMTDPAREPFKNKSLWEPVNKSLSSCGQRLEQQEIRKDIFISPVPSQPSPIGFPQPSVSVWSFSQHIWALQNARCLPISSMVRLICICKILLAGIMKIQYEPGLNSAFRSYSLPPLYCLRALRGLSLYKYDKVSILK